MGSVETEGPVSSDDSSILRRRRSRRQRAERLCGDSSRAEPAIELVGRHIERHLGSVTAVFDEIVSEVIHVHIQHVRPTADRPFHTLVTSGMSDRTMAAPAAAPACTHAELVALLPPGWPLSREAFADEAHYWPLRQLKLLARLPHECGTWLWSGHAVPNGDPPVPFAMSTKLCCSCLLPPVSLPESFAFLNAVDGRRIVFFALVPLYREEMAFKLRAGSEALVDRLDKASVGDIIDPQRVNVCRLGLKRLLGNTRPTEHDTRTTGA